MKYWYQTSPFQGYEEKNLTEAFGKNLFSSRKAKNQEDYWSTETLPQAN